MADSRLPEMSVVNVVASSDLKIEFDLDNLANDLDQADFDPQNSPNLIYRLPNHQSTIIITRHGKVISTGASTPESATDAIAKVVRKFDDMGIQVNPKNVEVEIDNIVLVSDLNKNINLNAAAILLGLESTEYEPEQFPGLIYRPNEYEGVILVFASGKLVITGTRDPTTAAKSIEHLVGKIEDL